MGTLLLEINKELLLEVMKIQAAQAAQVEAKKEESGLAATSPEGGDKEKTEKSKPTSRDYFECMRRLQANLAYLAAIADRSHKPDSQIPRHPATMTAPPLTSKGGLAGSPKQDSKKEESDDKKSGLKKPEEEENRAEILKEQYNCKNNSNSNSSRVKGRGRGKDKTKARHKIQILSKSSRMIFFGKR